MKKTMKRAFLIAVMVLMVLGFAGCSLFSGLPAILGTELAFTKDGLLKEDIVYTWANDDGDVSFTFSFKADGSYTWAEYRWSSTEEVWELDTGERGTYSYDKDTMIATLIAAETYSSTTELWTEPTDWPMTRTFPGYFTSQYYYHSDFMHSQLQSFQIYVADADTENTWSAVSAATISSGSSQTITSTISLDLEAGTYNLLIDRATYDDSGNLSIHDQAKYQGTILSTFPEGSKFRKGDTATFYNNVEYSERSYDTTGDVWDPWSTSTFIRDSETVLNMGDFIIVEPSLTATRGLTGGLD